MIENLSHAVVVARRQIGRVHLRDELLIRGPARVGACRVALTGIQRGAGAGSSGSEFILASSNTFVCVCVCE